MEKHNFWDFLFMLNIFSDVQISDFLFKILKGAVPDGSNKVIDFSSDWLQIGSILVVVWNIFFLCEVLTFLLVDKK